LSTRFSQSRSTLMADLKSVTSASLSFVREMR
jgi:hypothetical protein